MTVRIAGSGLAGALAFSSMNRAALSGFYLNTFIKRKKR